MIDTFVKIEECINNCLISKLSTPYNEKDFHSEYQVRNNKLEQNFPKLLDLIENVDFREHPEICSSTLYSLFILYMELRTEGPWNTENTKAQDYPSKLNLAFEKKYNLKFEDILLRDDFYKSQEVFDKCIKELHQKMTLDDFKKYPGLIEVYYLIISNVEKYNVTLNPVTVMPVALLLVDDYITSNKLKGLECCLWILECLKPNCFSTGNYYEVIYMSFKKNMHEKDIDVTKALFKCYPCFLPKLPLDVKKAKLDDVYAGILDQLNIETNLHRKVICFYFTTKMIEMHQIHCAKKRIYKDIIHDSLDMCTHNAAVYDILFIPAFECLLAWIRNCWCTWNLVSDQKILAVLLKVLYVTRDEKTKLQIQTLMITLISLCTLEEQHIIYNNLDSTPVSLHRDRDIMLRIKILKESMRIN